MCAVSILQGCNKTINFLAGEQQAIANEDDIIPDEPTDSDNGNNADDMDYQPEPRPGCSYHQDTVTVILPKK
jgi:hypothetical protein